MKGQLPVRVDSTEFIMTHAVRRNELGMLAQVSKGWRSSQGMSLFWFVKAQHTLTAWGEHSYL